MWGCSAGCKSVLVSRMPPWTLQRPRSGDRTQGLASIWGAPWSEKVPGGPSGEAPAHRTMAGLWQLPALCLEEQSLSSS